MSRSIAIILAFFCLLLAPPVLARDATHAPSTDLTSKASSGGGIYNTRVVLTSSGTYTAPVTGWYKVTAIGGGAGGGGGFGGAANYSGRGGGSGGISFGYKYYSQGAKVSYSIGAGGAGGQPLARGSMGGNTIFDGIVGGGGGTSANEAVGGRGDFYGSAGGQSLYVSGGMAVSGASGGGFGGGYGTPSDSNIIGLNAISFGGGGGAGGVVSNHAHFRGGSGYQGCVILEYYDPDKPEQ